MENNKLDYLIPEISKNITEHFFNILRNHPEIFMNDVDTSPLLNMTMGVFLSSLTHILDTIQKYTDGEPQLITNIEMTKSRLIKLFEDLPFVNKVEFI